MENRKVDLVKDVSTSNLSSDSKNYFLNNLTKGEEDKEVFGVLDKFLGTRNTKIYLVSILCIFFVIIVIVCLLIFHNNTAPFLEVLKTIVPIITLAFGYIVGEKAK